MNILAQCLVSLVLISALSSRCLAQPSANDGSCERKSTYPMIQQMVFAPLKAKATGQTNDKSSVPTLPATLPERLPAETTADPDLDPDVEFDAFVATRRASPRVYLKPSLVEMPSAADEGPSGERLILVDGPCLPPTGTLFYARGEYLFWRLRDAPNPAPLLTTGNPVADPNAGVVGAPSTRVLYGLDNIDLDYNSGGRITMGGWFVDGVGIEASGFLIADRTRAFSINSATAGNLLLGVPYLNAAGQERRFLLANPSGPLNPGNLVSTVGAAGTFSASHTTEFWGGDATMMFRLWRAKGIHVDALGGFAFRQLRETQTLNYALAPAAIPGGATIGGTAQDVFGTTNDFYGGQVGLRGGVQLGRFSFDVTGKLGVGADRQRLDIGGGSAFNGTFGPPFNPTSPYGVFAQRSNIGTYHDQRFTLLPEANAFLGFDVTRNLKIFGGYSYLYWMNVIRPGEQIDRTINTAAGSADFFTSLQRNAPPLGGRPTPTFTTTDFWAHGANVGIEFRY